MTRLKALGPLTVFVLVATVVIMMGCDSHVTAPDSEERTSEDTLQEGECSDLQFAVFPAPGH